MNHLTEEQLIEHYYEESPHSRSIARHLRGCHQCAETYAELRSDLDAIAPIPVPARVANHGEQVWQSIRNIVPVYQRKQQRLPLRFSHLKGLGFATACSLAIAVAFFAGRQWENQQRPPQIQTAANNPIRQPIVLVVMGDHLGRSERFLVALRHGDSGESTVRVKAEAQDLSPPTACIARARANPAIPSLPPLWIVWSASSSRSPTNLMTQARLALPNCRKN